MRRGRIALGVAMAMALTAGVLAQTSDTNDTGGAVSGDQTTPASPTPPGVPVLKAPPDTGDDANDTDDSDQGEATASNSAASKQAAVKPPPAVDVVKPVRSPTAIVQALDKVTAETIRFAAPVGQPVRYKNLVFTVKACETTGLGQPSPQATAFMVIDFAPLPADAGAPPPPKQVFKGWMFASSPGLNPFQHPTYDAWLISCTASAPAA